MRTYQRVITSVYNAQMAPTCVRTCASQERTYVKTSDVLLFGTIWDVIYLVGILCYGKLYLCILYGIAKYLPVYRQLLTVW